MENAGDIEDDNNINPYEDAVLYKEFYENLGSHEIIISMVNSLNDCIQQNDQRMINNGHDQPIKYFQCQLPFEGHVYQSVIDYILFQRKHYRYKDLGHFSKFFASNDWVIHYKSNPLPTINFLLSLEYVVFNFNGAKNNILPVVCSSNAATTLGEHLKPIFTSLVDSMYMSQLTNKYYNEYHVINKKFDLEMLTMLQQLYSSEYQEINPLFELDCQNYFKSVLGPMCEFIKLTSCKEMRIKDSNPKKVSGMDFIGNNHDAFLIKPDLVIFGEHNDARIVIEMKRAQMFRDFVIPEFNEVMMTLNDTLGGAYLSGVAENRFISMLKQLLVYMVGYKCARGILTDGYSVLLVEIDTSRLSEAVGKNSINEIPLVLNKFDCTSSNPSYLQGIFYFLLKSIMVPLKLDGNKLLHFEVRLRTKSIPELPEEEQDQEEKPAGRNRGAEHATLASQMHAGTGNYHQLNKEFEYESHLSDQLTALSSAGSEDKDKISQIPLTISWEDQPRVLQNIYNDLSHVVKIKAKFVKNYILEDIDDEDNVVVKIFDPNLANMEKLERSEIMFNVNKFYRQEKQAAEILLNSHVNTLYLKQVYGLATYNFGFGPLVSGKFIISRYLEATDLPFTDRILAMAKEQLLLIHEAGIVHGDVREPNVLFDKANNKIYLIDFGHATTNVDNDRMEGEFQELAEIFEEGRCRLGL